MSTFETCPTDYRYDSQGRIIYEAVDNTHSVEYDLDPSELYYDTHILKPEPQLLVKPEFEKIEEPPLLEELEIYPDRILEKVLTTLNPFQSNVLGNDAEFLLQNSDIAGPVGFCLLYALFLFLGGNKEPFGYVYGLSVGAVIFLYILFYLMSSNSNVFSVSSTASILGYSGIPIVLLAFVEIFVKLQGYLGLGFAFLTVVWASLSASKLYVIMTGDVEQRLLITYPCAVVYGVFAIVVIF